MKTDQTEPIQDTLERCNHCGFCQASCPTYRELWEESACARGRIRLFRAVLDGEQILTNNYIKKLDQCTGCMACTASCPSGAQPHRLIREARAHAVQTHGLSKVKSLALCNVLANETLHGLAFSLARQAQRLRLTDLAPDRFVPAGLDLNQFPVANKPFRSRISERSHSPEANGSVAFFVGCMVDHSLPNIGQATMNILRTLGIDVIVPKDLTCCGLPLIISGERNTAQSLAAHNVHILDQLPVDHIITVCASCGNALKNEYPELLQMTAFAEAAKRLADKTIDICAFLPSRMPKKSLSDTNITVTYHDPCHLVRGQGVKNEPRELIKMLPGIEFREMNEADRCCGAAGTFQIFFPETAWGITQKKLNDVRDSGADIVATACPACLQRIQGGIHKLGMTQSVLHIVELVEMALTNAAISHLDIAETGAKRL